MNLRRARVWFLGALLTLILSGVFRFAAVANEKGIRETCTECGGSGKTTLIGSLTCVDPLVGTFKVTQPCDPCGGKGFFWVWDHRVLQALPTFVGDLALVGILTIVGTIVYAFKVVDCRACDGEGCDRCGERGWLTAADRWSA